MVFPPEDRARYLLSIMTVIVFKKKRKLLLKIIRKIKIQGKVICFEKIFPGPDSSWKNAVTERKTKNLVSWKND